jgi:hypothetical protein
MIFQRSTRGASIVAMLVVASTIFAQETKQPAPAAPAAPAIVSVAGFDPAKLSEFVTTEFGPSFKVTPLKPHSMPSRSDANVTPITYLTGDLDGDGMEDAVIVTQVKNALLDQQQFNYKVADPYNGYFGFGDPRITHQFATQEPEREHALLVVHSWRQTAPKAKFVIINLPFDSLSLSRAMIKKKVRLAIVTEEGGMVHSSVYWDGKRYQYEPDTGDTID